MVTLRFDYRDLFRATKVAFSLQRLWIQFVGLVVGYGAFVLLNYLGAAASGGPLAVLWEKHGLFPDPTAFNLSWIGWILAGLGILILFVAWMVTATAVARAAYMHLKGNTFYTWKEAYRFAIKKKSISVVATPLAILSIAFFTGLGGVVVGLIARIPYVGEIGLSLFTPIWFMAALFIVFLLAAAVVSLLVTPAVLATTDDDAFEGIFQSFSLLSSQSWRLLLYEILVGILSLLGFAVFAIASKLAWRVMTLVFIWGMGQDYAQISYQAAYYLQTWLFPGLIWAKTLVGDGISSFFFAHYFVALKLSTLLQVSATITAVFLTLITTYVASYALASLHVGNTLIFLVLKKKKDDENLLERKDKEEEEPEEGKVEEKPAEGGGQEKTGEGEPEKKEA